MLRKETYAWKEQKRKIQVSCNYEKKRQRDKGSLKEKKKKWKKRRVDMDRSNLQRTLIIKTKR